MQNYITMHILAAGYSLSTIGCPCSCQVALCTRIPVIFITLMRFISSSGGGDVSGVVEKK